MTAPPALDPRVLESLRRLNHEGEPDVLTEVLGLFLADGPARLEAIAGAVSAADGQALLRRAHGLKGAASTIGASALAAACRELEEMGEKGEFGSADEALHVMRREYGRVEQVIGGLLRSQ